jgi:outer membrane lipoprotein-sorting protein
MNLKDNNPMQELQNMLTVCMSDNSSNISKAYCMEFYEDGNFYLISVLPVKTSSNPFRLELYLNKKDMSMEKVRLYETEGDYTEYQFSNKKMNTLGSDAMFKI